MYVQASIVLKQESEDRSEWGEQEWGGGVEEWSRVAEIMITRQQATFHPLSLESWQEFWEIKKQLNQWLHTWSFHTEIQHLWSHILGWWQFPWTRSSFKFQLTEYQDTDFVFLTVAIIFMHFSASTRVPFPCKINSQYFIHLMFIEFRNNIKGKDFNFPNQTFTSNNANISFEFDVLTFSEEATLQDSCFKPSDSAKSPLKGLSSQLWTLLKQNNEWEKRELIKTKNN